MSTGCTCIIPIYNEGRRIINLLRVIVNVEHLTEIICVDDGSTDNSSDLIEETFKKKVRVIRSPQNEGKAEAVNKGVHLATYDNILLLDGDLHNIKIRELEEVIAVFEEKQSVDMIILRRIYEAPFSKMIRGDITVSGERLLRKKDLIAILSLHPKRYQIEFAVNQYMIDNKKRVYWYNYSGTNPPKIDKIGFIGGMKKEIEMHADIISYIGLKNMLNQMFFFCRDEIK